MKRIYTLLFALMAVQIIAAQSISVGQFNVRYDSKKDAKKGDGWKQRAPKIASLIQYEDWDLIGAQEMLHNQLNDLQALLKEYDHIGVGRDDGAKRGEYAPIFYKKSRMRCLKQGTFWFSPTPDVAGSKGWDAAFPRICTWGQFEDKSNHWKVWVFNLHLDHIGVQARSESAKILLKKVEEMCGSEPYILTGDFNVDEKSEVYAELLQSGKLKDTYDIAKYRMAEVGTINLFDPENRLNERIDHIFVSPHFKVRNYGILTHSYWTSKNEKRHKARTYSDHYPVSATLELPRLRSREDWAQYGRYEKDNAKVEKAGVVFLGNSITDNWDRFAPEFFEENPGYICRGISGQVTAQMLARFRSDVINLKPDTVVILAGINDIAMNQGYCSLQHIFENIVSMAELARCNSITPVLCSILPADKIKWSWEIDSERAINSVKELNAMIESYAKEQELPYVDYYSEMVDENFALKKEYQSDPVHPNKAGYEVMERVVLKVLKNR